MAHENIWLYLFYTDINKYGHNLRITYTRNSNIYPLQFFWWLKYFRIRKIYLACYTNISFKKYKQTRVIQSSRNVGEI